MKKIFLLLISFFLVCCNNSEMIHYSVEIILRNELSNVNENDPLPNYITKIVNPIESKDTFYIPDVTIKRLDLPKEEPLKVEVPLIIENKIKKTLGTYDYDNLKEDYTENLPKIICGKYLTTKGNNESDEKPIQITDAMIYYLNPNNKISVDSTILAYSEQIKMNGGGKIVILIRQNENSITQIDETSTCGTSLPDYDWLRQELLKIIDTKRTLAERKQIAEKIWKENFYQECYVDNYMDKNDKNPEYWSSKHGMKYLTEHLVVFPSIIDITILTVERDKETQKVSGLKVCETYNGSKFNN
jgi:hypothetical protein